MKKIFKWLFVLFFLGINIGIISICVSVYLDNRESPSEENTDKKSIECPSDRPLLGKYTDCVACDYKEDVMLNEPFENTCPNRRIVKDECCGGYYSIIPPESSTYSFPDGSKKYCNPHMFCDPVDRKLITTKNILSLNNVVFIYLFFLVLFIRVFRKIKKLWLWLPILLLVINNIITLIL